MRLPRSARVGLVVLGISLVLTLVRFVVAYVLGAMLTRGAADTVFGQSLRLVWTPLLTDILFLGTAVTGLLGFALVWRGRRDLGSDYASRVGLAILAFLGAVIVLGLWAAAGLLLGFVPGMSGLVPWRNLLALLGTVFVGLALYGVLANLPLSGVRPVSAVALALGVAGGAVVFLASTVIRRGQLLGMEGAATALSVVSVVVWLSLCLWGWQALGTSRTGPPAATAPGQSS